MVKLAAGLLDRCGFWCVWAAEKLEIQRGIMKKRILIVGGGGREHAIAAALNKRNDVEIFAAPGNAGIAAIGTCIEIKAAEIEKIAAWALTNDVYMTVVAPDDPLAMGLVDLIEKGGGRAFGPRKDAAEIEASKVFAKKLMQKYNIPTAAYEIFDDAETAKSYLNRAEMPVVLKADGLALGKGVLICGTQEEAMSGVDELMTRQVFGNAGRRIVVEQFLTGREVSLLTFCDGKTVLPMASSRDFKRAKDGDGGLNTGGMGAYSPCPDFTEELLDKTMREIVYPTVRAMAAEGSPFKGVLYFGLMVDGNDVRVLEYNARFGDPETQVVLPRLKTDLLTVFDAVIDGRLHDIQLEWDERAAVCVIAASGGYPLSYRRGLEISLGSPGPDAYFYHAGTAFKEGKLVTSGGRVLGVTALGDSLKEARQRAYAEMKKVGFENMYYRKDICGREQ